jgi:hypothetical protein
MLLAESPTLQTFDSRAVGMPYLVHFWSFLAIHSPEPDDYPFLSMTKITTQFAHNGP